MRGIVNGTTNTVVNQKSYDAFDKLRYETNTAAAGEFAAAGYGFFGSMGSPAGFAVHTPSATFGFGESVARGLAFDARLIGVDARVGVMEARALSQTFQAAGRESLTAERLLPRILLPSSDIGAFERASVKSLAPGRVSETLTHRNGIFEVLSEQPISGTTRGAHRAAANRALLQQLEADPRMAGQFSDFLGNDVVSHMRSGSGALRNPPGAVWHHPIENPDVMWLLRRPTHVAPDLQPVLHPGNIGGFGTHFGN